MHHHFRSLGGWTFAFKDYIDLNITAYVDDPKMQDLAKIVDPYCKLLYSLIGSWYLDFRIDFLLQLILIV